MRHKLDYLNFSGQILLAEYASKNKGPRGKKKRGFLVLKQDFQQNENQASTNLYSTVAFASVKQLCCSTIQSFDKAKIS